MHNKLGFLEIAFTIFLVIVLSLSASGLVYSSAKLINNFSLLFTGQKTVGEISGHYSNYSSDRNMGSTKMYTNIIQYVDYNGKSHWLISDYSSSVPDNFDEVTVYYNKKKTSKAVQGSFTVIFLFPFLILCFSLLGLLVGMHFGQPIYVYIKKGLISLFCSHFHL